MEAIVMWVNQKSANFLRDHKPDSLPEPEDYPNRTCRGTCRFLFLLVLSITFALSVVYIIFTASPNIRVTAISDLQTKHHDFIPRHVYNTSDLTLSERLNIVSCLCNTTALSWKEFTKFYILNENSTEWDVFYGDVAGDIILPFDNGTVIPYDLPTKTVRTEHAPAKSQPFCDIAYMWPRDNSTICDSCWLMCMMMSGQLLADNKTTRYYLDPEIVHTPETLLESPILLTPEVLRVLVVQHARELLMRTRERMKVLFTTPAALAYNDGLTLFLLNVLISEDLKDWESYLRGAINQFNDINIRMSYSDINKPKVLVLNNSEGIAFMHMDVNWTRYSEMCKPQYCEVTEQMSLLRKVYWGFAFVGGFTTVMLAVVNVVLWPAIAFLLSQWGRKTSPPKPSMKTPRSSENEGDGLLPSGARSDESEMVSVSIAPGPLPPLQNTESTRRIQPERMMSRGREAHGPEDK